MPFRAGDTVKHGPTGETWGLMCDEKDGEVVPCGWPPTLAKASDCTLIEAASDAERVEQLQQSARSGHYWAHRAASQLAAYQPPATPDGSAE